MLVPKLEARNRLASIPCAVEARGTSKQCDNFGSVNIAVPQIEALVPQ
jgi:hypothetical protein